MGMATLTALTIVVYIQEHVGWGWGLGVPTIAMALSIIAFLVGSPFYKRIKPAGSPLVRLAQVIVAAVKKRKEKYQKTLLSCMKIESSMPPFLCM